MEPEGAVKRMRYETALVLGGGRCASWFLTPNRGDSPPKVIWTPRSVEHRLRQGIARRRCWTDVCVGVRETTHQEPRSEERQHV